MQNRSRKGRLLLALALWIAVMPGAAAPKHYRFGVLPLQSPVKLAEMFLPLTEHLSETTGTTTQFVTAPSFDVYMERVAERRYHLIYLNPLLYAKARESGYRAIAKVAEEPFTGILVVRRDGPIQSLDSVARLEGLRLGFPDPNAFAATVMTRQYLEDRGIPVEKTFKIEYFGSQDSAIMALHSGLVDMIGTWRPSLRSMSADIRARLKIIAETPPQPQMPIAVRDDLAPEEVAGIRAALLALRDSAEGRRVLRALDFAQGFVPASDAEYQGLGR